MSDKRLLLHICCAPDATVPWPELACEGYEVAGYFYGSNIHPESEWLLRLAAAERLAGILDRPLTVEPYEPEHWLARTADLAREPEGGARCARCFEIQLERCATFASHNGYDAICTTLTISPHKDARLINEIGARVAAAQGLQWVTRIWRKKDGFKRSVVRSRAYELYRQGYCGCMYSMNRDDKRDELGKEGKREEKGEKSGKLAPEALARSVFAHTGADRPEVLVGPAVGEDAAVIDWPAGKLMVFASDPIVGAAKGAGRLLVRVNVNDIASKGGEPAFIVVTLILPPPMGECAVSAIMAEIDAECRADGIAIVGGHTEFNDRYTHPVLNAALVGTADRVFRASDIRAGDVIYVTKHIGIEGMAILASDRPDLLAGVLSQAEIASVAGWIDQTSVLPESRLLRESASFMHDPTEGGFFGGLGEICRLAGLKAEVAREDVPVHPWTRRAAEALGFDPLKLVASGSMMAVVPQARAEAAEQIFASSGIPLARVGRMTAEPLGERNEAHEAHEELWGLLKRGRI